MNKKCTNSSCRKTFSTLNFVGVCPHCGKKYPQVMSPSQIRERARRRVRRINSRAQNRTKAGTVLVIGKNETIEFPIKKMPEIKAHIAAKHMVRACATFTKCFSEAGYWPTFAFAREFCKAVRDGKPLPTIAYLTENKYEKKITNDFTEFLSSIEE